MKLSNKILIVFAASLILIPVLGMIIVSATQYKTGTHADLVRQIENFSTPTKNMESVAVSTPFNSVNIADGRGMSLSIHFVKDVKYGIKIQNDLKGLVTTNVDANGQLQILIKEMPKSEQNGNGYYTTIYVYAPTVKSFNTAKAKDVNISANLDTLSLNIQKTNSVSFDQETKISQLNIKTDNVFSLYFRENKIKSIRLNLHNTNLKSELNSFDNLSIATSGKCEVELIGSYDQVERKYTINNLILNTNGIAIVKLDNIKVANCSGKLSDETLVQMPAVNLNQMFNKK